MRPFCASENEPRDMLTKYVGSEHWGWRQDERTTAKGAGDGSEPFFIFGCCCPLCSRQSHCLHQIFVFSRSGNSNGAQPFSPLSDPMIFFSYNAFDVFHCMRASVFMCIVVVAVDAHRCDVHTGWIYFTTEYISTWILFFFLLPHNRLLSFRWCSAAAAAMRAVAYTLPLVIVSVYEIWMTKKKSECSVSAAFVAFTHKHTLAGSLACCLLMT